MGLGEGTGEKALASAQHTRYDDKPKSLSSQQVFIGNIIKLRSIDTW
jgi:hypothetical protein